MILESQRRAPPPASLDPDAAALWVEILDSLRADYVLISERPILEAYCQAVVAARRAREMVSCEGPVIDGRLNPWMLALDQETKRSATLALRLRLAPQSRFDRTTAAGRVRPAARSRWDTDGDHPSPTALSRYGLS